MMIRMPESDDSSAGKLRFKCRIVMIQVPESDDSSAGRVRRHFDDDLNIDKARSYRDSYWWHKKWGNPNWDGQYGGERERGREGERGGEREEAGEECQSKPIIHSKERKNEKKEYVSDRASMRLSEQGVERARD